MRITIKGAAASLLSLALCMPGLVHAQGALDAIGLGTIVGGAPGSQGSDAGLDLSCQGRGANGGLACGDNGGDSGAKLCADVDNDFVCDDKDECPDTPPGTPVFANGCHTVELVEGKPLVLRGVNFDFDEASLTPESVPILQQAVVVLNAQPEVLVSIDGHTDAKGEDRYNERLSQARAKTVYEYFLNAGISGDRLVYRGFGESKPIAPNTHDDGSDNPPGRAENRRVELSVVSPENFSEIKQQIAAEEEARARREAERQRQRALAAEQAKAQSEAQEDGDADSEEAPQTTDDAEAMTDESGATETREPGTFDESEYLDFLSPEAQEVIQEETGDTDETSTEPAAEPDAEPAAEPGAESDAEEGDSSEGKFDESEYLEFLNELETEEGSSASDTTENSGN